MTTAKHIKELIAAYEFNGYLHGALLVAQSGEIIECKGFGYANVEHVVKNTASTKFRIGSLTKAFTSYAIFLLQEHGKLHIEDLVSQFIGDYPNGQRMNIYHCLTNTSGIPDFASAPDFWFKTMRLPSSLDERIEEIKAMPLSFEPGSEFDYSNSNYIVLTAIIEKVTGKSYADYMRDEIFIKFEMHNTGCDDGRKVVPNLASGYSLWERPIHAEFADMSFPLGAYGLYSTVEDLYKWDRKLKESGHLSNEIMEKLFMPYHDSYACGWIVSEVLNRRCVHHFGDISGFSSNFYRFIDDDVTIIFLSNLSITPVTHLTGEIARALFSEDVELPQLIKPIPIKRLDYLLGAYYVDGNEEMQLQISGDANGLYLTSPKMYGVPYKYPLIPIQQENEHTIFLTKYLNEKVVVHHSQLDGDKKLLHYLDCYGKEYICYAVKPETDYI